MDPRVQLLGSGTCRLSAIQAQTSAAAAFDHYLLLFDVGWGIPARLAESGMLATCKELHIHISHRHEDHLAGLFGLLEGLTWADDAQQLAVRRVVIHCTNEVHSLIQSVRSAFGESTTDLQGPAPGRELMFLPGPDHGDWDYAVGPLAVRSVHLPEFNNHGVRFTLDGKTYALSGDATIADDRLAEFLSGADVAVFDFGHLVNVHESGRFKIDLSPAVSVAVKSQCKVLLPAHVYLRHLQHRPLSEAERDAETDKLIEQFRADAQSAGFKGKIVAAMDLQQLDSL